MVTNDEDESNLLLNNESTNVAVDEQSHKTKQSVEIESFSELIGAVWHFYISHKLVGFVTCIVLTCVSLIFRWLIVRRANQLSSGLSRTTQRLINHKFQTSSDINVLDQLNHWPDVSQMNFGDSHLDTSDMHQTLNAQLEEWSGVDDAHLPPQITAKHRKQWLDRHVPLSWLHSIRESLEQSKPVPMPTADILPLTPLAKFFAGYTAFHAQQLRNITRETRFLIHQTPEYKFSGLGNRMESLASALILAALTKRILITDWHHYNASFDISDVFALPPIDWRWKIVPEHYNEQNVEMAMLSPFKHFTINEQWTNQFVRRDYEALLCGNALEAQDQEENRFLTIRSNQFFVPLLYHNRHHKQMLESWGFESSRLAAPIFRYLFSLVPPLKQKLDDFKAKEFSEYMIGVQIRTRDGHESNTDIISLAWRCGTFIASLLPQSWRNEQKTGYLLVTDNQETMSEEARRFLGQQAKLVMYQCPAGYEREAIECALIEMFLLAEVDDIVISKASTFGDVPRSMSMLHGYVLSKHMTCMRQPASDPCFHHWHFAQKLPCYDQRTMHQQEDINGYCVGRANARDPNS